MQILQKIKNYQEKEALIKSFSQNKSFGNIHQNNQYQSFNAKRQSDESTQDTKYNMNSTNVVGVYNNQYSNFLNDYDEILTGCEFTTLSAQLIDEDQGTML